jgi:hypothetical protein
MALLSQTYKFAPSCTRTLNGALLASRKRKVLFILSFLFLLRAVFLTAYIAKLDHYPSEKFKNEHPNNKFEQRPFELALQQQGDKEEGSGVVFGAPAERRQKQPDDDMGEAGAQEDPSLAGFIVPDNEGENEAPSDEDLILELDEADFDTSHFWFPIKWPFQLFFGVFKLPWITVTLQVL